MNGSGDTAGARVHDLVRVTPDIDAWRDAPPWVHAALRRAPWVVCRRARSDEVRLPIGVRGTRRCERYGAEVSWGSVLQTLRPEELVARLDRRDGRAAEAARRIAHRAQSYELAWGPTGSLGFELAAGVATTHPESDLDLIVRATGVARDVLCAFAAACDEVAHASRVRIDVELSFGDTGVALAEYRLAVDRVVAKTPDGPARIECPR